MGRGLLSFAGVPGRRVVVGGVKPLVFLARDAPTDQVGEDQHGASTLASAVPLSFAATKRLEATGWPFSRIMLDLSRETLGKGLDVIAMGAGVKMIITTISIT